MADKLTVIKETQKSDEKPGFIRNYFDKYISKKTRKRKGLVAGSYNKAARKGYEKALEDAGKI